MFKPLLTTALLFAAVPAVADTAPVAPSVRVTTSDLDLTTPAGRATLDRRLSAAVDLVCEAADTAPRTGILAPANHCRTTATAVARSQRDALIARVSANR